MINDGAQVSIKELFEMLIAIDSSDVCDLVNVSIMLLITQSIILYDGDTAIGRRESDDDCRLMETMCFPIIFVDCSCYSSCSGMNPIGALRRRGSSVTWRGHAGWTTTPHSQPCQRHINNSEQIIIHV